MPSIETVNNFLTRAYDVVGLKVLNDAAKNIPAVRYAGAVLIFAMLSVAGVAAFNGNLALLVTTVTCFIALGVLIVILGALATQQSERQAQVLSWVIVVSFSIAIALGVLVITSSFLFGYPRPIGEILHLQDFIVSLDDIDIALERDANGALMVMTRNAPRQPYLLEIDFFDPASGKKIGNIDFPIPVVGAQQDPSGSVSLPEAIRDVKCVLNLMIGKRSLKSRAIVVPVPNHK